LYPELKPIAADADLDLWQRLVVNLGQLDHL
jgi:hypothetical protein